MLLGPVFLPWLGVVLAAPGNFGALQRQTKGVEDGSSRTHRDTHVQRDQLRKGKEAGG